MISSTEMGRTEIKIRRLLVQQELKVSRGQDQSLIQEDKEQILCMVLLKNAREWILQ
jgi:hypothetical protein